jgi:hypothetical protein
MEVLHAALRYLKKIMSMKRVLIILIAILCFNGCEKERIIIDWVPVTFKIQVQDLQGNDMLDPTNDNTWLIGTEISFRNYSEVMDENDISPVTKAILPEYGAARVEKGSDCYYIAFGEFHRMDNDKELMTIKWPDGSISEITYKCRLIESKIEVKETFELNGKKCSNPIIIVK